MSYDPFGQWVPDDSLADGMDDTFPDVGQDPLDYDDSIGDTTSPPFGQ